MEYLQNAAQLEQIDQIVIDKVEHLHILPVSIHKVQVHLRYLIRVFKPVFPPQNRPHIDKPVIERVLNH